VDESRNLFDSLLRQSKAVWGTSPDQPPTFIWERGDVVPIGKFDWDAADWTCLRRDGEVVTCASPLEDTDFQGHNYAVGMLMQQIPAASAYLRPSDVVQVCPRCDGSGRRLAEVCGCGGLGWLDSWPTLP
jgi:hypothetical protein